VRRHGLQRVESRSALNVDGAVHLSVGEAKRIGGSVAANSDIMLGSILAAM
jgi:hypothetical protein